MCELCREEDDDDYEGETIAEKRRKATRSIVERHPELGLDPDDVTFRFVPKAEESCVRVNLDTEAPRYEIHVPRYVAQAMSGSPSLSGIATAAWVESDGSYEEICGILDIPARRRYGAFFVSESPPLNSARADAAPGVHQYEEDVRDHLDGGNSETDA